MKCNIKISYEHFNFKISSSAALDYSLASEKWKLFSADTTWDPLSAAQNNMFWIYAGQICRKARVISLRCSSANAQNGSWIGLACTGTKWTLLEAWSSSAVAHSPESMGSRGCARRRCPERGCPWMLDILFSHGMPIINLYSWVGTSSAITILIEIMVCWGIFSIYPFTRPAPKRLVLASFVCKGKLSFRHWSNASCTQLIRQGLQPRRERSESTSSPEPMRPPQADNVTHLEGDARFPYPPWYLVY